MGRNEINFPEWSRDTDEKNYERLFSVLFRVSGRYDACFTQLIPLRYMRYIIL